MTLLQFLLLNHRKSNFIHPWAYRQIPTATNYYKYSFFPRTVVHWDALTTSIIMLPTLTHFSVLFAGWCVCPLNGQILFLAFNYTNMLCHDHLSCWRGHGTTLFSYCTNLFHPLFFSFISTNPLKHLAYRIPF